MWEYAVSARAVTSVGPPQRRPARRSARDQRGKRADEPRDRIRIAARKGRAEQARRADGAESRGEQGDVSRAVETEVPVEQRRNGQHHERVQEMEPERRPE